MAPPRIGKGEVRGRDVKGVHGVDLGEIRAAEEVPSTSFSMGRVADKWRRLFGTDGTIDIGRRFRLWKSARMTQSNLPEEKIPLKLFFLRREFKRFLKTWDGASHGHLEKYLPVLKSEDIPQLLKMAERNHNIRNFICKIAEERPELFARYPNNERLLAELADDYDSASVARAIVHLEGRSYHLSAHSLEIAARYHTEEASNLLYERAILSRDNLFVSQAIDALMHIGVRNPYYASRIASKLEVLANLHVKLFEGRILDRILEEDSGRYDQLISTLVRKGNPHVVEEIALGHPASTRAAIDRLFEMTKNGDEGADRALIRILYDGRDSLRNDDMPKLFELAERYDTAELYRKIWSFFPILARSRPDLFGSDEIARLIEVGPSIHSRTESVETLLILSRGYPGKFSQDHLVLLGTMAVNNNQLAPVLRNLAIFGNEEIGGLAIDMITNNTGRCDFALAAAEAAGQVNRERLRLFSIPALIDATRYDVMPVNTLMLIAQRRPESFDSKEILESLLAAATKRRELIMVIDRLKPQLAKHGIGEDDLRRLGLSSPR